MVIVYVCPIWQIKRCPPPITVVLERVVQKAISANLGLNILKHLCLHLYNFVHQISTNPGLINHLLNNWPQIILLMPG